MSASTTITFTRETPVLRLISDDANSLLDRLAGILERHTEWSDDLSRRLFQWGAQAVVLTDQCQGMTLQEFRERVARQLDELSFQILVNPLTNDPLLDPVLDREWVWEREMLDRHLEESTTSPFDGQTIEAKTHQFAVEMIAWLRSVRQTSAIPERAHERVEITENAVVTHHNLAQQAQKVKQLRTLQEMLKQQKRREEEIANETRRILQEEEAKLQQRMAESEQALSSRMDSLSETHQAHVDALTTQMGGLQMRVSETQNRLERAEGDIGERDARIRELIAGNEELQRRVRQAEDDADSACVIL